MCGRGRRRPTKPSVCARRRARKHHRAASVPLRVCNRAGVSRPTRINIIASTTDCSPAYPPANERVCIRFFFFFPPVPYNIHINVFTYVYYVSCPRNSSVVVHSESVRVVHAGRLSAGRRRLRDARAPTPSPRTVVRRESTRKTAGRRRRHNRRILRPGSGHASRTPARTVILLFIVYVTAAGFCAGTFVCVSVTMRSAVPRVSRRSRVEGRRRSSRR